MRRRTSTPAADAPAGMPNSVAVPLVARAMPSRTLIVVVLPAPLRPRNPQIEPAGTARLKPRSASTAPYCLRRSDVSMTNASLTLTSCAVRSRQRRLEQAADFLVGDTAGAKALDGGRDERLPGAQLVGRLLRPSVRGYKRA